MPVDNSRPHGNHFSADTRQACGAAGDRTIDSSRPNPGTTDTFMKAAQPQQTARQAQRSFASNSFHPGDVRPGGTSRACACSNNRHGTSSSLYTSMHDDLINDPCHSDSTKPKKARLSAWLWASSSSPSLRLVAPRAFSCTRTRKVFRRRQARSCLRSRP